MLTALWAAPLRGEPVCGAARHLLAAEAAAETVLLAEAAPDAARAVEELERRLALFAAEAGPREPPVAGGSGGPVGAYLLSRRALVAAFRERGLDGAWTLLRDPAFGRVRQDLDALLWREGLCASAPAAAGAAGAGEAAGGAGGTGSRRAAAARERAIGARPPGTGGGVRLPPGGDAPLPAADLRTGLMVVLGLGLLLLALSALDPARHGDERRVVCRIAAQLRVRGASQPAVIVELGRRSAKLRTEGRFAPGDRGALSLAGATVPVRLKWVTPSFTGVTFQSRPEHWPELRPEAPPRRPA